jgi:hypothetical protein
MTEEELAILLDAIGPDGGTDEPQEGVWERLALGDLDEAEANQLRVRASSSATERDMLDLFEPLDDDYAARTTQRLMSLRPDAPAPVVWSEADKRASIPTSAPVPAAAPRASLLERLVAAFRQPVWVGTMVTAAAVMLVFGGNLGGPEPLPSYDLVMMSGDKLVRSEDAANVSQGVVFSEGSLMRVTLTPAVSVIHDVDLAVFERVDDAWRPVALSVETAGDGAFLLEGIVGEELSATPGMHTLKAILVAQDGVDVSPESVSGVDGVVALEWTYRVPAAQ